MKIMRRTNSEDVFDKLHEQETGDEKPDTVEDRATEETDAAVESEPEAEDETAAQNDGEDGTPEVDTDEPSESPGPEEEESAKPSRVRRWLRRVLAAVVGLVFVAALGLSGFLGWQVKQQHDVAAAGHAALAVAQSYAVTLTSIDPNGIDKNFTDVLNGATGEFKDMYSESAAQLRQLLIDNKATSKGTVVDSAIKSGSKTKVEILLFIDQSIINSVNPEPRIDRSRVAITMELVDNRWLASKVDIK
ncbi:MULTISPECIES: DUF3329 domain-containing protein [unclassified Mycobacterium]|uniref:DUF3329 domain-containing protein n=1 Tax=unclassified Mycobacterium TaxID=2642494 RepID=UPI0029C98FD8|nr:MULTISPECIES: DUF3329 domain-containing protein [unclassified Mycobacterium]